MRAGGTVVTGHSTRKVETHRSKKIESNRLGYMKSIFGLHTGTHRQM